MSPTACPTCGAENPTGSRFCNDCGAALVAPRLEAERKVITALFCDLVGFTATAEGADPEDVDRMLTRYFTTARSHIQGHGGVVEKFIGDAVVGVFGVPAAHEDDPERAVRAGLRIAEDAAGLPGLDDGPLRLRIGINTGEALVRLGVDPGAGERFLAGDAINTASRIQSVAPEMGVAVGQATFESTKTRFEYDELPLATVKGKAEPLRVFHARAPRARLGTDVARTDPTTFVGRQTELRRLTGLFDEAVESASLRYVGIVGEPGLGKSRLVAELLTYVEAQPILVTWRQGRCLPYGSGISFWALGEIVKAHAGILESDPVPVAQAKLDEVLPVGTERPWFRERLLPLLGIESGSEAERDEQFTAWRRFLSMLAEQRPTVLVFEDLHWADEAMLTFLEQLVQREIGAPLLVVGTARPELYDRRPDFPADGLAAQRVDVEPLSPNDCRRLIDRLLATNAIAPELVGPILERSGGNPLFTEEFVRLLRDRDQLESIDGTLTLRQGTTLPVPESIAALLAARLDALPADWKSMLADAAVIGKVFWSGAVESMAGRDPRDVAAAMDGLARREFIRPSRRSSMAGEDEFVFWHVLARDVAYAALPRAARASRHVAAARWIESKAIDRLEDVAAVLAHHYATALDLARAVGATEAAAELEASAFRFETLAGERALGLDVPVAIQLLERALVLAPPGHPERGAALGRYAQAMYHDGRYPDAAAAFEEAIAEHRAAGNVIATAQLLGSLGSCLRIFGDSRSHDVAHEAVSLLEPLGPSPQLAEAIARTASRAAVDGHAEEALAGLHRALEVAEIAPFPREADQLGFRGGVLGFIGFSRTTQGESRGLDDMREAIALATAAGQGMRAAIHYNNLAAQLSSFEGADAAINVVDEAIPFATSRGLRGEATTLMSLRLELMYDAGDHEKVLNEAPANEGLLEELGAVYPYLLEVRATLTRIITLRGEPSSRERLEWLDQASHRAGDVEVLVAGLGATAPAWLLLDPDRARAQLAEVAATEQSGAPYWYPRLVPSIVRTALALDDVGLAEAIIGGFMPRYPLAEHAKVSATAAVLEARGRFAAAAPAYQDAAARWRAVSIPERGYALAGQGRSLAALGRQAEADASVRAAQNIFEQLRAAPGAAEYGP